MTDKERIEALKKEVLWFRRAYAICYTKAGGYFDDGELQDNTDYPFIDFLRDGTDEIERKQRERFERSLRAITDHEAP